MALFLQSVIERYFNNQIFYFYLHENIFLSRNYSEKIEINCY